MNLSETHENFDKVKNIILYLQNVIYRWGCSKKAVFACADGIAGHCHWLFEKGSGARSSQSLRKRRAGAAISGGGRVRSAEIKRKEDQIIRPQSTLQLLP